MNQSDTEALKALVERRIPAALKRITDGHGLMRVPAEDTDPDLVLADCRAALERLLAGQQEQVAWLDPISGKAVSDAHMDRLGGPREEWLKVYKVPLFAAPPVQEAGRLTTPEAGSLAHQGAIKEPASLGAAEALEKLANRIGTAATVNGYSAEVQEVLRTFRDEVRAIAQHQPIKAGTAHAERATPSHEDKELK